MSKDKVKNEMSSDVSFSQKALLLKDPNYSPASSQGLGDVKTEIDSDKDFTDGTNDISATSKKTLGSYLSSKTKKNYYQISSPSKDYQDSTGFGKRGSDLSSVSGEQEAFFPNSEAPQLQYSGLGVDSKEGTFFTDEQLGQLISKTGFDEKLSGHELLKSVPESGISQSKEIPEGEGTGFKLLQEIHKQLETGNLFSPDGRIQTKEFISNKNAGVETEATNGIFTVQRTLGQYNKNSVAISASDIQNRILKILEEQVRQSENVDQPVFESQVKNYFTNEPQQGVSQYSVRNYTSGTADPGPSLDSQYPYKLQSSFPVNGRRVDYSHKRTFDDETGSLDVTKQAILWVITATFKYTFEGSAKFEKIKKNRFVSLNLKQKIPGLLTILSTTGYPVLLEYGKRHSRRSWESASEGDLDSEWYKQIADFDNDFTRSVGRGILLFFGNLSDRDYEKNTIIEKFKDQLPFSVRQSPGFFLSLMRSLQLEGPAIKNSTSNKQIVSSKIYKFAMTMAGLGDIALKSERGMRDVTPSERQLTKEAQRFVQPTIAAAAVVAAAAAEDGDKANSTKVKIGGALLGTFRRHISRWSPLELQDGSGGSQPESLSTFFSTHKAVPGVGRQTTRPRGIRGLTPDRKNVELIENALESEYMPFYIHDLRTHDVISMPAFITEFGESFEANYNNIEGIGRQDPVRLYSKTERKANLSFILASFSEEDFDHLWLTVNKLVSMCYPQYSAGRLRELSSSSATSSRQFIQPFSQVQAASPMVRLRLGDVFKSNYSKFGVARLFGANSRALPASKVNDQVKISDAKKALESSRSSLAVAGANVYSIVVKGLSSALEIALAKTDAGTRVSQDSYDEGGIGATGVVQRILNYVSNNQAEDARLLALKAIDFALDSIEKSEIALSNENNQFPDRDFFSSDKNAIVRSFESTRGKGVAGFISSLTLDYDIAATNFEIKMGKRAPQMVKISMGFLPITDLPLGLDYDGNMRNPSHPVGRFAGGFGDVYDDFSDSTGFGSSIAAKDFNSRILNTKYKNGQVAADVVVDAAFAVDDTTKKP